MDKIRILLAEDEVITRMAFSRLLNHNIKFRVAGEASNGMELIKKYNALKPDIVLSDIIMPIMDGIEASSKILLRDKSARIILVTAHDETEYFRSAIMAGVAGFISKFLPETDLINAIRLVYDGINYFPCKSQEEIEEIKKNHLYTGVRVEDAARFTITKREKEILLNVAEGSTSMEIATKLNISRRTVDFHRAQLLDKLNLKSSAKLIKYAVEFANNLMVKKDRDITLP